MKLLILRWKLKNIDITVEEKATGEVLVGAGVGSEGGTAQFSVSENNFLEKELNYLLV